MAPHLQRSLGALLFISVILTAFSQEPTPREFPYLKELKIEFYQTDVQITNLDQQITAFATEYYDESLGPPRTRLDLLVMGERTTILYYNETEEILEIESSKCKVSDVGDTMLDYEPVFYGWLNKDPLIIGPSAPLWLAENNRDKIKIAGITTIRGIECNTFTMEWIDDRNNVTFSYYFAVNDWKTPYKFDNLRVPVRIEVRGITSEDSEKADQWVEINQYTDFAYFRPTISNWRVFNAPLGIGCPLKKSTKTMPKFPKVYHYSAEVVDLKQAANEEINDIEYQEIWYDYNNQLARYDKFGRTGYESDLYDFNTGVTYSIEDGYRCTIKPLRHSMFEGFDNQVIGHMKEPAEVLGLDEKFYYMGKKLIRGIWADVYESVTEDQTFMKTECKKLVLTFYYSTEYFEVVVEGNTETRVPVFYTVKGYDVNNSVVINYQFNIYGFDDAVGEDMYGHFGLDECFPSMNEKSYFLLVMDASDELAEIMEGQDDFIMEQLRIKITKNAKVSDLRLPLLRADYTSSGVVVTGVMLDRPPALKQFWLEYTGDSKVYDKHLRIAPDADTKEKCAYACVDEDKFTCTGFHFCTKDCYLKSKDILDPIEDDDPPYTLGNCEEWLRAERFSNNKEAYLTDALSSLENAVLNEKINVTIKINPDDPKNNDETVVPITDIVIGDGPYGGKGNVEKPYEQKIQFAKLNPDDETTEIISWIDNLNDCYQACKDAEDKSCSSFSYCPTASNKQCSISSILVIDRKANFNDLTDDQNCYVYSMKYLDFYEKYPGRLAMLSGDEVIKGVMFPEDCARLCRMTTDFNCRGFEYCQKSKTCIMHSKHVLDIKEHNIDPKKKLECVHYATKFIADYQMLGYSLVDDKSDVRTEITLEECAKICSEEMKDKCKSFNFCPASQPHMGDSSCAISSLTIDTPKVPTTIKKPCEHYEKKKQVDDWAKSKNAISTSGYTSKGFTGLVIGMLILGFALGAVGFVVYSYFRSKSSGEGMTVRFMKQDNI